MNYELFIAGRYLRSKRKTRFISLNTFFSVGGIMVGVMALIIVLSVLNGFEEKVRDIIIGTDTHLYVMREQGEGFGEYRQLVADLEKNEQVVAGAPLIFSKAMITADTYNSGVQIKGIDPESFGKISNLEENIVYGRLLLDNVAGEDTTAGTTYPGIVLGRYLADMLRLRPGQELVIMSLEGMDIGQLWAAPKMGRFVVTGIFETGLYEYDSNIGYISLAAAQDLLGLPGQVNRVGVVTRDLYQVEEVGKQLASQLAKGFRVENWIERNKNLYSSMTMEKWVTFIVLCLIILVAAFNIVSTLIMIVMEKSGEIGILKSMGAQVRSIVRIFMWQGFLVCGVGIGLGGLAGFILCWVQQTWQPISLPQDIYFLSSLPVRMEAADFGFIFIAAVTICVAAALYPAFKAAQLEPVETIRFRR